MPSDSPPDKGLSPLAAALQRPATIGFDHVSHHHQKRAEWTNRVMFGINGLELVLLGGLGLLAIAAGLIPNPFVTGGNGSNGDVGGGSGVYTGPGSISESPGLTPAAGEAHGLTTGPTATGSVTGRTQTLAQWQRQLVVQRSVFLRTDEGNPRHEHARALWHEAWEALQNWPAVANKYPDAPPPAETSFYGGSAAASSSSSSSGGSSGGGVAGTGTGSGSGGGGGRII